MRNRSVAAHEVLAGLFTEGASGLDFGVGELLGQFRRRAPDEQEAINARIDSYSRNYRPGFDRRGDETDEEYDRRLNASDQGREVVRIQREAGVRPPVRPPTDDDDDTSARRISVGGSPSGSVRDATGTTGPVAGSALQSAATALTPPHQSLPESSTAGAPTASGGPDGQTGRSRDSHGTHPDDMVRRLEEEDLEDLAGLLYGRLRTRLRRELLIDRERTGLLTDFR